MNNIVTYKSLQAVSIGEQILELKVSNIGEGSGDFVGVKTFFTIMRQVPKNSSIDEVFTKYTPQMKKKPAKQASAQMSH